MHCSVWEWSLYLCEHYFVYAWSLDLCEHCSVWAWSLYLCEHALCGHDRSVWVKASIRVCTWSLSLLLIRDKCMRACILRKGSNVTTQVVINQKIQIKSDTIRCTKHPCLHTWVLFDNPRESIRGNLSGKYKYSDFGVVSILLLIRHWTAERPSVRLAGSDPSSPFPTLHTTSRYGLWVIFEVSVWHILVNLLRTHWLFGNEIVPSYRYWPVGKLWAQRAMFHPGCCSKCSLTPHILGMSGRGVQRGPGRRNRGEERL